MSMKSFGEEAGGFGYGAGDAPVPPALLAPHDDFSARPVDPEALTYGELPAVPKRYVKGTSTPEWHVPRPSVSRSGEARVFATGAAALGFAALLLFYVFHGQGGPKVGKNPNHAYSGVPPIVLSPTPAPTSTPRPKPTTTPAPATATPKPQPTATPDQGPFLVLATANTPDGDVSAGESVYANCLTSTSVVLADGHIEPLGDFDPNTLEPVSKC